MTGQGGAPGSVRAPGNTGRHTATAFYEDIWNGPTGWRYFGWHCSCGDEEYVSRPDGGLDECERRAAAHMSDQASRAAR